MQRPEQGICAAALVAATTRSTSEQISGRGATAATASAEDIANGGGDSYALVGYCDMGKLPGFRLDPPRNNTSRTALVLISKADEHEGLHIQALEYIEPDQLENAARCMQKLRMLCKCVQSVSTEKRSREIDLACLSAEGMSPNRGTKTRRTLQAVPSDLGLP